MWWGRLPSSAGPALVWLGLVEIPGMSGGNFQVGANAVVGSGGGGGGGGKSITLSSPVGDFMFAPLYYGLVLVQGASPPGGRPGQMQGASSSGAQPVQVKVQQQPPPRARMMVASDGQTFIFRPGAGRGGRLGAPRGGAAGTSRASGS